MKIKLTELHEGVSVSLSLGFSPDVFVHLSEGSTTAAVDDYDKEEFLEAVIDQAVQKVTPLLRQARQELSICLIRQYTALLERHLQENQ